MAFQFILWLDILTFPIRDLLKLCNKLKVIPNGFFENLKLLDEFSAFNQNGKPA